MPTSQNKQFMPIRKSAMLQAHRHCVKVYHEAHVCIQKHKATLVICIEYKINQYSVRNQSLFWESSELRTYRLNAWINFWLWNSAQEPMGQYSKSTSRWVLFRIRVDRVWLRGNRRCYSMKGCGGINCFSEYGCGAWVKSNRAEDNHTPHYIFGSPRSIQFDSFLKKHRMIIVLNLI